MFCCFRKNEKCAVPSAPPLLPVPMSPPTPQPAPPRTIRPLPLRLTHPEKKERMSILLSIVSPAFPEGLSGLEGPGFLIRSSIDADVDFENVCFKESENKWVVITSIADLGFYRGDPIEFPKKYEHILRPRIFTDSQVMRLKAWSNWEEPKTFHNTMAYIESLSSSEISNTVNNGMNHKEYQVYYDKLKRYFAILTKLEKEVYFMPTKVLKKLVAELN